MVLIVGSYRVSVTKAERRRAEPGEVERSAAERNCRLEALEQVLARERARCVARLLLRF